MKITLIVLAAVAVVIVALVGWVISLYNGLVVLRNRFKNALARRCEYGRRGNGPEG